MKKAGILNAQLICELTKLRHEDKFVICDAGFPIPNGANVVDVSLIAGIPDFIQVLKAVLNELIVEEYMIFDFMKDYNKEYYTQLHNFFKTQKYSEVSMQEFIECSKEAKLFIRTGELKPASNIMMVSATGVKEMNQDFDVRFDQII